MKLLILAQSGPPHHGQSRAVQTLVRALSSDRNFELKHINLELSRNSADIGRWRLGKIYTTIGTGLKGLWVLLTTGSCWLYYVPAPAKRSALYRDWIILLLCRPWARGLILHWHAVGLGAWLQTKATSAERWMTQRLLGRAALAIVLAENLRADAEVLRPRLCRVVAGGVPDPAPEWVRPERKGSVLEILFVGLGCVEKGLFATIDGAGRAHRDGCPCRLTVAGSFASPADEQKFHQRARELGPERLRHLGFVTDQERSRLLMESDVLCFPTFYPYEGQPAVLLEAMAFDLPIIATRWRAIPEMLPTQGVWFVEPNSPEQIAASLGTVRASASPRGALRAHYLANFTEERHLAAMKSALITTLEH
jgi:glycosyltransferase involved in cell wall biosynthesis